ncbi:MAG TPA: hypothetical protein VEB86_09455, partial [Chryseosolibacter sp.]|nr:hypothetical protein [Chryseosolibacter sp.]
IIRKRNTLSTDKELLTKLKSYAKAAVSIGRVKMGYKKRNPAFENAGFFPSLTFPLTTIYRKA